MWLLLYMLESALLSTNKVNQEARTRENTANKTAQTHP